MSRTRGYLLTAPEAAAQLDVDVATLKRWRRTGDGPPALMIGRAVRYHPRALEEYTEAKQGHGRPD